MEFLTQWKIRFEKERRNPRSVVAEVLDCGILVSEFEPQSRYYVYFWINTLGKGKKLLILSTMG